MHQHINMQLETCCTTYQKGSQAPAPHLTPAGALLASLCSILPTQEPALLDTWGRTVCMGYQCMHLCTYCHDLC